MVRIPYDWNDEHNECNFGYMQSCASTDIYLPIMVSILKGKGEFSLMSCNLIVDASSYVIEVPTLIGKHLCQQFVI